jgi:hypothetical protein
VAVLIAVVSPPYLKSEWTRRPRRRAACAFTIRRAFSRY